MDLEKKRQTDHILGGIGTFLLKPIVVLLGKVLRRDHTLRPTGDILVLKLLGGGSLILAYPALHSLKKTMPASQKLVLITTKPIAPFAEQLELFDKIYALDDGSFLKLFTSVTLTALKIVGKIDTCIDLEIHSRGTAILSLLSGARNRLGFFKEDIYWRIGMYTHLVFYNTYSRSASFYNSLIGLLGVDVEGLDHSITSFSKAFATTPLKTIAVGYACSNNAPERMLHPKQWAEFVKKLNLDSEYSITLLGGPEDRNLGSKIKQEIEEKTGITCINCAGTLSLKESIQRIAASSQFIGIDSGLLHFARLLGKDTISFWGPTDPHTRLSPRTIGQDTIHYQKITCSPCVHFASTPPCHGKNRCMDAVFNPEIASKNITWAVLPANISETVEIAK